MNKKLLNVLGITTVLGMVGFFIYKHLREHKDLRQLYLQNSGSIGTNQYKNTESSSGSIGTTQYTSDIATINQSKNTESSSGSISTTQYTSDIATTKNTESSSGSIGTTQYTNSGTLVGTQYINNGFINNGTINVYQSGWDGSSNMGWNPNFADRIVSSGSIGTLQYGGYDWLYPSSAAIGTWQYNLNSILSNTGFYKSAIGTSQYNN